MKKFFVIICFYPIFQSLHAQIKSKNYFDITKKANEYFSGNGKKAFGYNQYKRLEWYYKTRVDLNGNLVNNSKYKQQALIQTNFMATPLSNNFDVMLNAHSGAWNLVGPTEVLGGVKGIGRVNRITFHPTNANTFFVSSAGGGLWRTTNAGAGWSCLTNGLPNINTSGMVIDYTNTNIMYLLTGDGESLGGGAFDEFGYGKYSIGVLKTFDGGQTWFQTQLSWDESDEVRAYKIVIHPTNPNIVLVATNQGLWNTENGGSTWVRTPTGDATNDFYDIEFKPGAPATVFASSSKGFFRSTNNGTSFTKTNTLTSIGSGRTALAVCPSNTNRVYVLAGKVIGDNKFRGFFRFNDADATLTFINDSPNILGRDGSGVDSADQSGYDLAMAVKPDNSNYVITGGIREWITTNGGTSFTFESNIDYHDDIHDIVYNPLNNKLYMCGDGGVYVSNDHGKSWDDLNTGLAVSQYYKISVSPNNGSLILGGLQDNGTNRRGSNTTTFLQVLGADGMDCAFAGTNSIAYASTQEGNFYKSSDLGLTFTKIITPDILAIFDIDVGKNWVVPMAIHPADADTIFLSYQNALVKAWRSTLGWNNFKKIQSSGGAFIKIGISNNNRIYNGDNEFMGSGGKQNYVRRSDNGGSTWTTIRNQFRSAAPPVTDLAINPGNSLEIWLTYGGYEENTKVEYSSDGGATFINLTGSLPNIPINSIVYASSTSDAKDPVFIGTDIGVFYRDNNLGDWVPYSNGLPVVEVTDIEFSPEDNKLRIGTYGRGIWESTLFSSCQSDLNLTTANQAINMPFNHQASNSITSTAWVLGTGSKVFYKAANYIDLKQGFFGASYDNETIFLGRIGTCGGGVPFDVNSVSITPIEKSGYLQNSLRASTLKE